MSPGKSGFFEFKKLFSENFVFLKKVIKLWAHFTYEEKS
jgi:hypothetical protein